MRRAQFTLVIVMLLVSCSLKAETPQPSATTPTTPTDTPLPEKQRLFMISWDAGRADMVYALMEQGVLPTFRQLADQGLRAEYALSVDPTLSAAAQNSITTGCYPDKTGMVSNAFHNPNDSFYWYRRGFDELLDQAEPVWVTASRAGLSSAALFFMGGSPDHLGQTADYTIGYGVRDAYSRQQLVDITPLQQAWDGQMPTSYSPPLEGSYTIREVARVHLYVFDRSDDQVTNYDAVMLNTDRVFDGSVPPLGIGEWGTLVLAPRLFSGADFKIQDIRIEGQSGTVTLFQSNVFHNIAAPRSLLEELNQVYGFFPPGADYYALDQGWITPEDNLVLLERAALWMARVAAWVEESYQPDLLITWQDGFDAAGHAFMLQDPRQMDYSPENAARYAGFYQQAAQIADQALTIMLGAINLEGTTLLMVSDHGMAPIHTVVNINTILEEAGLLTLDSRNYVVVDETRAFAIASGGAAHIYINLEGHEKDGIVPVEEYPIIQEQVYQLFSSLIDPSSGSAVFERVLRKDELAQVRLDHTNSGDIFVQAATGYHLDDWRGKDHIFEPADFYGQHGYSSSLPEMQAMFIAAGAGIPVTGEVIPPVRIIDVAPTIAAILGFKPASNVDGQPIPALVKSSAR